MDFSESVKSWISQHQPNGDIKFALRTGLSISIIHKLKNGSYHSRLNYRTKQALIKGLENKK